MFSLLKFTSIYVVGIVALMPRILFDTDIQIAATISNIAFLFPLFTCLFDRSLISAPVLLLILTFAGSTAHHARNCRIASYRVLDVAPIFVSYTYFSIWCIDTVFKRLNITNVHYFVVQRFFLIILIFCCIFWYESIVDKQIQLICAFTAITATTFLSICFTKHPFFQDIFSLAAVAVSLLSTYGVGLTANEINVSAWIGGTKYEILHSTWHIMMAQGQYILVCILCYASSDNANQVKIVKLDLLLFAMSLIPILLIVAIEKIHLNLWFAWVCNVLAFAPFALWYVYNYIVHKRRNDDITVSEDLREVTVIADFVTQSKKRHVLPVVFLKPLGKGRRLSPVYL